MYFGMGLYYNGTANVMKAGSAVKRSDRMVCDYSCPKTKKCVACQVVSVLLQIILVKRFVCVSLAFFLLAGSVSFARWVIHPTGTVVSVVFSPDGKKIVTGTEGGTIQVFDAESGKELHRFEHAD